MKYYCIGIKGAGMATLANLLHDLGHQVSGYDDVAEWKFTQAGLDERNIQIYNGGSCDLDKDTIVTFSRAFREDHPEIVRVRNLGCQLKAYNEIIGDLTKEFKTVSVSGTHGKTTTSSLISHVLNETLGTNYFIGDGSGHADPKNSLFVIESDEFNRHFLAYHPTYSVITNIELEHTECYKDIDDIVETFTKFANENTSELVVACGDNEYIRGISFEKEVILYGFQEENDVVAKNVLFDSNGCSFDVYKKGELYGHFELPLFGRHMVLNALACIIVCDHLGITSDKIQELLRTFKNAKRRFAEEIVGDTVIIDDYAHHPTEIRVTLEAARQKYPDRELVVLFKPNTYSRTAAFPKEFSDSMNVADKAYLTEIDCNRERPEDYPGVSSKIVLDGLRNGEMIDSNSVSKLLNHRGSVICFMSCASIEHLKQDFKDLLN